MHDTVIDDIALRDRIRQNLIDKANIHQIVYDNTYNVFSQLKEILNEMSSELDDQTEGQLDRRIKIEYRDRGKFEAQLQVAGDVLIFSMHTNVFEFHREHAVWENRYVMDDRRNSYCGMISIYNFLSDSLKYNRGKDEGYLVARLFINKDMCYFVEGKRQEGIRHGRFGSGKVDREVLIRVVECSLNYALEFDLLVPSYDRSKIVTVDQLNTKIEHSKIQTGKRLGYRFNSDDI